MHRITGGLAAAAVIQAFIPMRADRRTPFRASLRRTGKKNS